MTAARFVAVAALVGTASLQQTAAAPTPASLAGVWEAQRVNTKALPMTDEVVGDDGFTHAIKLQGMTIRLMPNKRFQAALKYRRAILSKGEQVDKVPLQNDTWVGVYTLTGTKLRFVPDPQGKIKVQPFDGQVVGKRISVGFDYEIVKKKHYVLDLDKNANVF